MANEPIKEIEESGCTIRIFTEDSPEDPRDEDNLGKMWCFHRNYSLGDKLPYSWRECPFDSWEDMEKYLFKEEDALVVLPLYLYDHSGVTMKTSPFGCRWDSGQVGFTFATRKGVLKEYSKMRISKQLIEKVKKVLRSEVERYDQYLTNDIYGYVVEDEHGEHIGSRWGYYGSNWLENRLLEDAKDEIAFRRKTQSGGDANGEKTNNET